MVRLISTLYIILFFSIGSQAQNVFFSTIDNWATRAPIELDSSYVLIGQGFTSLWFNKIIFTELDKSGEFLDSWEYSIAEDTHTEIRNQQSFNYKERKILGITAQRAGELPNARRLFLDDNITEVLDGNWIYPNSDATIMFNTLQHKNKILSGLGSQDANNDTRFKFIATDTTGNLLWEKNYLCPDECWMFPSHIIPTPDGGYLLTVEELRSPPPVGPEHEVSTLIKTDSLGVFEWRIYPGGLGMPYTSNDILALPTDDGNILCVWTDRRKRRELATIFYEQNEEQTLWFSKIDLNGNKLWEKNIKEELSIWNPYEHFGELFQMIQLSDGNFAISTVRMLIKVTQEAELIWARDITPPLFTPPNAGQSSWIPILGIIETSDGGFLCTGEAWINPGDAFPDFVQTGFVIKVDEHGCLNEGCQLVDVDEIVEKEKNTLLIYPNPASRDITIDYQLPYTPVSLTLSIHNITGKAVHTQPLPTHESSMRIELGEHLPAGTYFCHLMIDGQVIDVERFVLVR